MKKSRTQAFQKSNLTGGTVQPQVVKKYENEVKSNNRIDEFEKLKNRKITQDSNNVTYKDLKDPAPYPIIGFDFISSKDFPQISILGK